MEKNSEVDGKQSLSIRRQRVQDSDGKIPGQTAPESISQERSGESDFVCQCEEIKILSPEERTMNLQDFHAQLLAQQSSSEPTETEQRAILMLALAIGSDPKEWPEERRGWRTPSEVGLPCFYESPYWKVDKSKPTWRIHISSEGEKWISEHEIGPDGQLRKK